MWQRSSKNQSLYTLYGVLEHRQVERPSECVSPWRGKLPKLSVTVPTGVSRERAQPSAPCRSTGASFLSRRSQQAWTWWLCCCQPHTRKPEAICCLFSRRAGKIMAALLYAFTYTIWNYLVCSSPYAPCAPPCGRWKALKGRKWARQKPEELMFVAWVRLKQKSLPLCIKWWGIATRIL